MQRLADPCFSDQQLMIQNQQIKDDNLHIEWGDGHSSVYPLDFLEKNNGG